ncbi:MAG: hypothetical protein LAP13_21040 [Acidobacteriia bacterium]|nr:hypothetical protein [Terriglobia bacterium]
MEKHHILAGLLLLVATLGFMSLKYLRAPRRSPLRLWGWMGLGIILGSELLLALPVYWVTVFFTPLAWTGYILLVDALVATLEGHSRLTRAPLQFLGLAFWSIPLWLIFEAYNLRLKNWAYVGVPVDEWIAIPGYAWAFATIWPAIFETSDLIRALGIFRSEARHAWTLSRLLRAIFLSVGVIFLIVPLVVPEARARYLFGAVWVGFILLLDPLSYYWGERSLLRELEMGRASTLYSLLLAGWVCGIVWEFWNYWAASRWVYVFPIWQQSKLFEMPLPGFLGFPPFALECWVMYEFVRTARRQIFGSRQAARWEAVESQT